MKKRSTTDVLAYGTALLLAIAGSIISVCTASDALAIILAPPSIELHCVQPLVAYRLISTGIATVSILVVFFLPAGLLLKRLNPRILACVVGYILSLCFAAGPINSNIMLFAHGIYFDRHLSLNDRCLQWLLGEDGDTLIHRFGVPDLQEISFDKSATMTYRVFHLMSRNVDVIFSLKDSRVSSIRIETKEGNRILSTKLVP